jgi:cytochrome P450
MTSTDLPVFPGEREARCPLNPPADYAQWREEEGLRRVNWNGHTVWAVSRYEDIKTAMSHPTISAEVLGVLQSRGAHEGPNPPEMFPRMDDPEHARLRRMLTKDFTVKRINAMRRTSKRCRTSSSTR